MSMADNIKYSKHKEIQGKKYHLYDNYDAIEIPYSDAIPCDYEGMIGVPITFFDKYCPEQFEIVGITKTWFGMANKVWMGCTIHGGDREFGVPDEYPLEAAGCRIDENGKKYIRVKGVRWYTNIDHGSRHDPLSLMSMADNIKYSKHKDIQGKKYQHYDNYDAIEIPYTDAIPCDYENLMGVPVTFLDKYCPEQFDIIWQACGNTRASAPKEILDEVGYTIHPEDRGGCGVVNNKRQYARILIRKKQS